MLGVDFWLGAGFFFCLGFFLGMFAEHRARDHYEKRKVDPVEKERDRFN